MITRFTFIFLGSTLLFLASCAKQNPNDPTTAPGVVSAPTFSRNGGNVYEPTFSIAISDSTREAIIRYTVDGSTPSETNGTLYSNRLVSPMSLQSPSCSIKAIAYKNGMQSSSVASAIFQLSPILSWQMNEANGSTLTDGSGLDYLGSFVGNILWTEGKSRSGLLFDNSQATAYINGGSASNISFTDHFSIALWIKPSLITNQNTLLSKTGGSVSAGNARGFQLFINAGQFHPAFSFYSGNSVESLFGSAVVPSNLWTHLVVTFQSGRASLYVNGAFDSSRVFSYTLPTTADKLILNSLSQGFNLVGAMDGLRIYNFSLTEAEVKGLYASGE